MKSKLLPCTPGNSDTIHVKTSHTNVILSYTEGLHMATLNPTPVLSNLERAKPRPEVSEVRL